MTSLLLLCVTLAPAQDTATKVLIERWVKDLDSGTLERKKAALFELGSLGSDVGPAVPAIAKALRDPELDVRKQAAATLRKLNVHAKSAVAAMGESLKSDKEEAVRRQVAFALKQLGPNAAEAIPALKAALKDKDDEIRCVVADALGRMGPAGADAVGALSAVVQDGQAGPHAIQALLNLGEPGKKAIPDLVKALKNAEIRGYAAQALGKMEALDELAKAVKDRDEDVRIEVVIGLQLMGKKAVPTLITALKDKSPDVRANTAVVIGKLGKDAKEAVADLAKLLGDENGEVRFRAAAALGAIGPDAKAALPDLLKIKDDKEEKVRDAIKEAVGKIEGK